MSAYLDTRDLDKELDELQERGACDVCGGNGADVDFEDGCQHVFSAPLTDEEEERLPALVALRDEIGSEWRHGVTLIPDSEFEEYAQELAEDCYTIPDTFAPYIDWSKWADDLRGDYSSVDFDGETYWYRS